MRCEAIAVGSTLVVINTVEYPVWDWKAEKGDLLEVTGVVPNYGYAKGVLRGPNRKLKALQYCVSFKRLENTEHVDAEETV